MLNYESSMSSTELARQFDDLESDEELVEEQFNINAEVFEAKQP